MDVVIVNAVLDFYPLNVGKPLTNHLRIFLEYSLAILRSIIYHIKLVRTLYESRYPVIATGFPPRIANSLSAISATSQSRGANPRESRSRIYRIIVCSSVVVSFQRFGWQLARAVIPLNL